MHTGKARKIVPESVTYDDEDSYDDNWATNVTREKEEEDHIQDLKPTAQERRLGLDINMSRTREPNLGSTRSQTRTLRSPFRSQLKEHADLDLDDLTGFYASPNSFWSCTLVNSCQNYTLYIYQSTYFIDYFI